MFKTAIILVAVLSIPAFTFSDTIIVPDDYAKIQEAIDAAVNGDTVLVKPGTYVENIDFKGKAITVMSSDGPHCTVIDGQSKLVSVVRFLTGEGLDSVLGGFTITNGSGKLIPDGRAGGGIYCETASPTITNNLITKNKANWSGGGIYCEDASPMISNNIITDNHADHATELTGGGGIALQGSSPAIINNIISWNTAAGTNFNAGGGIVCVGSFSSPLISNNLIFGNSANFGAGIFCSWSPAPTISNNVIFENSANGRGGGMQFWNSSGPALVSNNTLFGNTAQESGGGIECNASSELTVTNMILWNNDAPVGPEITVNDVNSPSTFTISYSDVKGGQTGVYIDTGCTLNWGPGMIDADPLLVDPANGDFHLTFLSPCRGSGNNSAVTELYDFEGDPRICQSTVDMGADECYRHLYCMGDFTPGGSIEGKLVGLPGTNPVGLFIGSGVLATPFNTMWGEYWLQAPWVLFGPLGAIPADGVMVLPATLPPGMTVPVDIPMQALIGLNADSLSNLCVLEVR